MPAPELIVLTQDDLRILRDVARAHREAPANPFGRPIVDFDQHSPAPETYVAKAPTGGIPARSGSSPGYVDCDIYRVVNNADAPDLVPVTSLSKRILNLSTTAIDADDFVPVVRSKFGSWYALSSTGSSSSSDSGTGTDNGDGTGSDCPALYGLTVDDFEILTSADYVPAYSDGCLGLLELGACSSDTGTDNATTTDCCEETYSEETASFITDDTHEVVKVANTTDITITLEEAPDEGKTLTFVKTTDNNDEVAIEASGSDAIIGVDNSYFVLSLYVQGDSVVLKYDGSGNWLVTSIHLTPHVSKLTSTSAQAFSGATLTTVTFNTANASVGGGANTGSNRVDILRDGLYLVFGKVAAFVTDDGEYMQAYLYVNGSEVNGLYRGLSSTTNDAPSGLVGTLLSLEAGDYVQLVLYSRNDGGNTYVGTVGWYPMLHVSEVIS